MEDRLKILQDIGRVRCPKCNDWCLLDYYLHYFVCQGCGTKYVFKEGEE